MSSTQTTPQYAKPATIPASYQLITRPVQTINQLLSHTTAEKVLEPQSCLAWVREINAAYQAVFRPDQEAQDIVDLKLSMIFWRSRLLQHLITQPPSWAATRHDLMLRILQSINSLISPEQQKLAARFLPPPAMARLMASQGSATPGYPELDRESGPSLNLNIIANRGSSWPYEKWREIDQLARYQFEEEGVRYRGISFRPGDVLLANVNLDGNGVYTALSDPRSFSSHSAFFAMLEYRGKRFPVVIETYEKGVRPVPLSIFLGPRFSSYVEVYRHRDCSADHAAKINEAALEILRNVRAYNFDTEDMDPNYMSCTTVGRVMLQAAGLQPARTIGAMQHPVIRQNLLKLDYTYFDFFGPVDFLLNDCFRPVGVVDNNQIESLLTRELIDHEFRQVWSTGELDADKFPFTYKLNLWGLGQMRRQTLLGKLFSRIEGFTVETLPKGPDRVLAAILIIEKQVGQAITQTRTTVENVLADYRQLEMKVFAADDRIQQALRQNLNLSWLPRP